MPFRARNPYYLRISDKNVLPLYVYLDEQHLNWMSDNVLQHVLADLQPKILPKLKAEADAAATPAGNKKATVDTHRGDSYQFAYFIRKTEPHSVLIKTRHFSAAPPQPKLNMNMNMPPPPSQQQGSKRKGHKSKSPKVSNKRRKTKGKGKAREGDESDEAQSSEDEDVVEPDVDGLTLRRSQRSKKIVAGGYGADGVSPDSDIEMEDRPQPANLHAHEQHQNPDDSEPIQVKDEMSEPRLSQPPSVHHDSSGGAAATPIDIDDEEEKPKPVLTLKYQDFSIYGHCLCIIVEPYPLVRSASRAASRVPSMAPLFAESRAQSVAPSTAGSLRARTPLFLPDDSEDAERGETPAPSFRQGSRPPVPLFDEDIDDGQDSDDNGGMIAFSQVMNSYNHLPAGAADDDDDIDGAVFFGDADEVREL
ncbi:hypothetical protein C8F04DRAFT_1021788 [Mycena alexandri]|uniref:Uncharacterized protein n=1 Tax=Mycena alexandri TaxID=1745969 RepID=A0AAD6XGI8_9AGAR|nr:hypothetical protein C8F04DRAFT_1021788 [Mycena alexandri]